MTPQRKYRFDQAARTHLALALLALCVFSLAGGAARAQGVADAARTAEVARVVLGIVSYVRWPAPHAELQMCVLGEARHADALLDNQGGPGARLRARRLGAGGPAPVLADCQVAYIGALAEAEREKFFTQLIGRPILVISEPIVPCSVANMFCLTFRDAQVTFDVNLDAIARSGLRVHPNALRIAKRPAPQP